MTSKPFFRQPYLLQLLILLFSMAIVTWHVSYSIRTFQLQRTAQDLEARALLILPQVTDRVAGGDIGPLRAYINQAGTASSTRITVVRTDGTVLADSLEDPALMDNHADRPEIIAALEGAPRPALRYSTTLDKTMMYVAVPLVNHGGVLRTSTPVTAIDQALRAIHRRIALIIGIVSLFAMFASWLAARQLGRRLDLIKAGAERYATGDFAHKLALEGPGEFKDIAASLNQMATQLDDRLQAISRQRNELSAVFASMVEGVFVFDRSERFLSVNAAGNHIIGLQHRDIVGRSLIEVVRNSDLLEFVRKTLASATIQEAEIVVEQAPTRQFYQAHGVPITDAYGGKAGALIVLNDITRLRRLEQVRRDFVSNVSHELRTPVTSIKGFVETLRDGALEDPEHAKKFLEIIAGQTDRLNAIINDLLALSRLEQQASRDEIKLNRATVDKPIANAIQVCADAAGKKEITVNHQPTPAIQAPINAPLLEQAFVNLIDNAIKYNPSGTMVKIETAQSGDEVLITITDNGVGIDAQHLPRIFERFYRADSSRSGKNSGTGLGLAIVKHIVQAHHGSISVSSTFRQGTTFTVRLPA